ncbi:MAG: DUF4199 domain-containing protein [Bacteroidales bacterium]|nr:DUF4199 domain-containing protein [Bacteroidales bacterium]
MANNNYNNNKGAIALQLIMRAGFLLGLYFMLEYVVTVWSTQYILLSLVHVPMMLLTVVLLFLLLRPLRILFADEGLSTLRAWTYGVQLMFFAGLLEALFVYVYNDWLYPDNLSEMHRAMIEQYRQAVDMMQAAKADQSMPSLMQTLHDSRKVIEEAPVQKPIEAAMSALSNDITYAVFWMIPLGFILRTKPQQTQNQ